MKNHAKARSQFAVVARVACGAFGLWLVGAGAAGAATLFASLITNNVSPVLMTADQLLTVTGYSDSNATAQANLGQQGNWFGVTGGNNATAIDTTKAVTLSFATNAALYGIGHIWTRSQVIISGFASDPGFTDPAGYAASVGYSGGTLRYYYGWDSGSEHDFTFANPAASAGRTLRINVDDTTAGWQATITRVDYSPSPAAAVADVAAVRQTMANFSAADAWSMQVVGLWPDTNQLNLIADLLFTTNQGIGLSAWRFNLAAGFDPTIASNSPGYQPWRTENGFLTGSNQYDWTQQPGQRWFLRAAKARGVGQYIAHCYSPPTNYTRNGLAWSTDNIYSSNLQPGAAPAFAQEVADVLAHFQTNPVAAEQITFDYITPDNEPYYDWNSNTQEGCRYGNADLVALAQAFSAALSSRQLPAQILMPEAGDIQSLSQVQSTTYNYGETYGDYFTALGGLSGVIAPLLSAHSYFSDNAATQLVPDRQALAQQLAANPQWGYWQTEYSILGPGGPGRDLTMTTGLNVARVIWADLAVAGASAWHWWLSISPSNYKDGLLYTDYFYPGDPMTVYCSKNFWQLGQWSRFIRPGWRRFDLPGYASLQGLMGAAFASPDTNSLALVFVNAADTNQNVVPGIVHLAPGQAVACWSPWVTSALPADNLASLPPTAPGAPVRLPPFSVATYVAAIVNSNTAAPPMVAAMPDQKVAEGQRCYATATVSSSVVPAGLLAVSVSSDNPALLPAANLILSNIPPAAITWEFFTNVFGGAISNLAAAPAFPGSPNFSQPAGRFEAPLNFAGNYGVRMRGYLMAPETGEYTLWIAGGGASQLYLSQDDNPAGRTLVAEVTNATAARAWTAASSQQSAQVFLQAGRHYYVEAVQASSPAGNNLAVGWQLPDGSLERPIPGPRLLPWSDPFTPTNSALIVMQLVTNMTGTAHVVVAATDTLGRSGTNAFTLTVNNSYQHPTAVVGGGGVSCGGGAVLVQAALTGVPPWTVTWSDGLVETTNASPAERLVAPVGTAAYSVLALLDNNGAADAADLFGNAVAAVPVAPLVWTGLETNWLSPDPGVWQDAAGTPVDFCPGLAVVFKDAATGAAPFSVTLNSAVSPSSILVSNLASGYLISGSGNLTGSGTSLVKTGGGSATLAVACTFGGGVTNAQGTLQIGNGGPAGNLPNLVPVENDGVLVFNRSLSSTWVPPSPGVFGSGLLVQNGPGSLIFGNDYVFGGKGSKPTQALMVGPGAVLETVRQQPAGPVTLQGGTLLGAGGDNTTYQSWVLTGGVVVRSNNLPSLISSTGANSAIHLLGGEVFDVAAGSAPDELVVSARLINPTSEYGAAGGGIVKLGAGTMEISGLDACTGDNVVSNGWLVVNGTVSGQVTVASGAVLAGAGAVLSNVTVQVGGLLDLGASLAPFTVQGALTLAGTVVLSLNPALVPSNNLVRVSGTLTFGGTLDVTNAGGSLVAGDRFELFSEAGSGSFTAVNLPPLGNGLAWTNNLASDGSISVVATVNASPTRLAWQLDGGHLALDWPADHIGWELEAQTNALSSGLGTNWTVVGGSSLSNFWLAPLDGAHGTVFYRLIYNP